MTFRSFKYLPRRKACSKVLYDKAFEIASNPIQSMMDINFDWHQWSTNFMIRRLEILVLRQQQEYLRIKNSSMNYIILSLKKLKSPRHTHLIEIRFWVLIWQTFS